MSKEKTLRTLEETEMMQATGIPTQEADGAGVVMATEIIADLKKERDDLQENLDICAGLADYKKEAVQMLQEINDDSLLEFFYRFIARVLKNRGY